MPKLKHTYICRKGYAAQYQERPVTWDKWTTPDEAIANGAFDSIETIMQLANAQLDIKKGHAIQEATVEVTKDKEGKKTTTLVNPNLSLADMEKIAASTVAKKTDRAPKGTGGVKAQAKKAQTTQTKAQALLSSDTLTIEKLDGLLEVEAISQADYDTAKARLLVPKNQTAADRAVEASKAATAKPTKK